MIDAMRTWLCEQDKAWYREEMHMLILLWHKAVKVDGFFMEKQGIDQKPSVLTVCNFHDSGINVDREKKKGTYFLGTLHAYNIVTGAEDSSQPQDSSQSSSSHQ